jgi:hypothetical protein
VAALNVYFLVNLSGLEEGVCPALTRYIDRQARDILLTQICIMLVVWILCVLPVYWHTGRFIFSTAPADIFSVRNAYTHTHTNTHNSVGSSGA